MKKAALLIKKIDKELKLAEEASQGMNDAYYQGYMEALQKIRMEIIYDFNLKRDLSDF